jgi:hypothetical protein
VTAARDPAEYAPRMSDRGDRQSTPNDQLPTPKKGESAGHESVTETTKPIRIRMTVGRNPEGIIIFIDR